MKYITFEKRCKETDIGKAIFQKWIDGKLPLSWAILILKQLT